MKKSIYSIAVLLGTLFLTACGSDEEMPYEKKAPEAKEETVVEKEKDKKQDSPESKAYTYDNPVTLTLETCGTLRALLGDSLTTADKLVLTGPLDANDVSTFLNDMPALLSLDLTETTFVENSLTFYNKKYSSSTKLSLKENQIVPYMFYEQGYNKLKEIKLPKGITKIGEWAFCGYGLKDYDKLESVTLPEGLVSIGEYAFAYNTKLTNLVLPQTLKTIGNFAFATCIQLTNSGFPESLESIGSGAFRFCKQFKEVVLPESLISFGEQCFESCDALEEVVIPEGITELPYSIFENCKSLSKVTLPTTLTTVGDYAFHDCYALEEVTIPEGVTQLQVCVFWGCSSLTKVNLPSTLTAIGESAFLSCKALTKVDFLPTSLTSLGGGCFNYCEALEEVVIPEGITELPYSIFENCKSLSKVTLPTTLTAIGNSAFRSCSGLTKVDFLPTSLTSLGIRCFDYCQSIVEASIPESVTVIPSDCFRFCRSLVSVTLPDGITRIESGAFYECNELTNVKLPASLTFMGYESFCNCGKLTLTSPQLPESLTAMEGRVFHNDGAITELVFPGGLSEIATETCWNCHALERVVISEGTTTISDSAFKNAHALTDASITLPSTLTSIGSYAFENTAIANMDFLPEGLQTVNNHVFKGCKLGKVLRFPSTLTTLADYALDGQSATVAAIYLPATSGSVTVGNIFGITPSNGIGTSNCLIYTEGNVTSHATLPNVITNNTCLSLVLAEGTPFHCPEAFTAGKVTFKKQFNQGDEYYNNGYTHNLYSTKGKASHWYGLSLPFTVTEITTADGRTFAPFNSDVEGANPFWLRRPSPSGFENVTRIEAGEPYIIAFPCNESYDDVYNVWGDVTFTGKNVTIPVTEEYQINGEYYTMKRNYELKEESGSMYLLNSPRWGYYGSGSSDYDSVNPDGKRGNSNYGWGSRFVPSLRQSWAFEAYLSAGITTSYFSVSPESASRSVRTLGAVPQIDDM